MVDASALPDYGRYKGDIYALCARLLQRIEGLRGIANLEPTRGEAVDYAVDHG